jgi:hypothetical protein
MRMAAGKGLTTPALMVNGFGCALLMTTQGDPTLRGKAHWRCFSGWTKTFTDPSLRRLTFGGNIIETGTDSYRLAHTRAGQQARQRKACGHAA